MTVTVSSVASAWGSFSYDAKKTRPAWRRPTRPIGGAVEDGFENPTNDLSRPSWGEKLHRFHHGRQKGRRARESQERARPAAVWAGLEPGRAVVSTNDVDHRLGVGDRLIGAATNFTVPCTGQILRKRATSTGR
jgi:hypothetical protein